MYKIIIGVVALLVVLVFLVWRFMPINSSPQSSGPVTLAYWDFWDEESIKPLLDKFEETNPNIKVTYNKQSATNYRTRVQAQILANSGPDVFRIHNSWLSMFNGYLSVAPKEIFSISEYQNTFYPVVTDSFLKDDQIYGAPLEIDGLALYVNTDILQAAGVSIPNSWQQLVDGAVKMTVRDSTGAVKTAGVALGVPNNVDYWSDILGLLLLQQPGVSLENPTTSQVSEVLKFFTSFVLDPAKKTWDVTLPSSTAMFTQGNLAFYFAPSSQASLIKVANPNLKFSIVPVPQLSGRQVAWGSFWGEAVSVTSKHQKQSWQFIKYLTSAEVERVLARPYARTELASEPLTDANLGAYVAQGPFYKFWYLSGGTLDLGLNDEMIGVWTEIVNEVLAGSDPLITLTNKSPKMKEVTDAYIKPLPSPTKK